MPVEFSCPCGNAYSLADTMAGKSIRCVGCHSLIAVPVLVKAPARPLPNGIHRARLGRGVRLLLPPLLLLLAVAGILLIRGRAGAGLDWWQREALAYSKKYAMEPSSFEAVEWRPSVPCDRNPWNVPCDRAVLLLAREKNGFGGLMLVKYLVYFKDGEVVRRESNYQHILDGGFDILVRQAYGEAPLDPIADARPDPSDPSIRPNKNARAAPK